MTLVSRPSLTLTTQASEPDPVSYTHLVPGAGWGKRYRFSGSDPMGLADAAAAARRLGEMDQLEQFLRSASSPGALAEVDLDQVAKHLGDDAARSLDSLARLAKDCLLYTSRCV